MIKKLNYISLFSSAGIGCYGFKQNNFECIATCELLEKRLEIQKFNNKCKYDSGYILGDITEKEIYNKIIREIKKWNKENKLDVIIATPPCQGMSVANQKKKIEINRNSLVVKAIEIVKNILPKIFIFENVPTFLKTICTGLDKKNKEISKEIDLVLSPVYKILSKVINFKNYGSNSSRTRTLVIGVRKDCLDQITPFEIFPNFEEEKLLKDVLTEFKSLKNMGEIDENNILHNFKSYEKRMKPWISSLKEGESAFDNKKRSNIPHKIVNGQIVYYKRGFGDKYKRQCWNKVAPCIHTLNGCLASQNTIHPTDDRVFSIAELMKLMTIPHEFKWDINDINELNKLPEKNKKEWIKRKDNTIRSCIGEAVPTKIFFKIANNIKNILIDKKDLYSFSSKFEKSNERKKEDAAYFTTRINLSYIYDILPEFKQNEINILEPSVGIGNFLIPIFKKYENIKKVNLTVVDINDKAIKNLKKILKNIVPKNINIKYVNSDFLTYNLDKKFDLILGNPPFKELKTSREFSNTFELFWKKSLQISKNIILITPKYILSSPKHEAFRNEMEKYNITNIIDFGELGFKDVKIETIAISIEHNNKSEFIKVFSINKNLILQQNKNYIFSKDIPYWIIYRDKNFDDLYFKMEKDIFNIKKNYELSNSVMETEKGINKIWVIKSKNIDIYKPNELNNIKNYDRYVKKEIALSTNFYKYLKDCKKDLYLIPTLTYYPRVIKMPKNILVNGSVLVAELKKPHIVIKDSDLSFFYTREFRDFYSKAFNYSTRTLNIDSNTIKFFGVLR